MKTRWFVISLLVLVVIGGIVYYNTFHKHVHYHAGFRVYLDGKLQDFSDFKYMRISPCAQGESHGPVDEQVEKAHLHDGNGDVVHVHRAGPVWSDLFINLKYPIPASKPVMGYIHGKKVENILNSPIRAYDSVVIVIGKAPPSRMMKEVARERIEAVEKQSEYCAGKE